MADQPPPLDSLFAAALEIASDDERQAFLDAACRGDRGLREQVDRLLRSHAAAGGFLSRPAAELAATIGPAATEKDLAAVLDAGLSPAFRGDQAVVVGSTSHSVLQSLGQTVHLPRVVLRDSRGEGDDPVARPNSPEMPERNPDSRYQVQGEIARGGMGAILKGRDTDLGRDLAIKVLLDSHKDKPEIIQRFIEEAQIGGQLQHPGIAPVYELGQFADRRPFFSMKLVKGETLSRLLADRSDSGADRGKFIGIFEQICQTMAYAHSRGVIHRDLKPSNVMIGAFGEVQVMDWGLAKVLPVGGVADERKAQEQPGPSQVQTLRSQRGSDASGGEVGSVGSQTQIGSVMGTPAYMPPEQASGDIEKLDERADVFGLGAILCEILTGQPPYVADDGTRIHRMAIRGELAPCLQRLETCGADRELVALVKQCLAIVPHDRPRDAGAVAERVSKYLQSVETKLRDAELASRDAQVRAEELGRRQTLALWAGAAIVASLLVGISVSWWQALRASEAEQQAIGEAQRASVAEKKAIADALRATQAEKRATESLQQVAAERDAKELARQNAEQIANFLGRVFVSPDPSRDGREIKVVELLDNAVAELESSLTANPLVKARLRQTLGDTYFALGLFPASLALREKVRSFYETHLGAEHEDTLSASMDLAVTYGQLGRRDQALPMMEKILVATRKVHGPEHTNTLSAMGNLAIAYSQVGRYAEALQLQEELLPLSAKLLGPEDPNTLKGMYNLASSYSDAGRGEAAVELLEKLLVLRRKVSGPEHPDTISTMTNLGICLGQVGRQQEALKLREQTLQLSRKVLGPEHPLTLGDMTNLADSLAKADRLPEAIRLQEQSLALKRRLLPRDHPWLGHAFVQLAAFDEAAGRQDDAARLREEWKSLSEGK